MQLKTAHFSSERNQERGFLPGVTETEMNLVDYASSSDDDVSEAEEQQDKDEQSRNPNEQSEISKQRPRPQKSGSSSSNQRQETVPLHSLPPPTFEKLPDASDLFNSVSLPVVTGTDHASRVAAAMAESATRKRDSNGVASTLRRSKLPKGNLPNSKDVLDTAGGLLVPPQLSGRSNVVTEDISKLFVRRSAEPSSR